VGLSRQAAARLAGPACALALLLLACSPAPKPVRTLAVPGDCNLQLRACTGADAEGSLSLRLLVPQLRALQPFDVEVRLSRPGASQVQVNFQMVGMEMGQNRFQLARVAPGDWRGQAMLPFCWTGRRDWRAAVEVVDGSERYQATFLFAIEG
jgi:hypothetical protein